MERMWRSLGLNLGKYWYAVLGVVIVITVVLATLGASQIEFATGQDSYLNSDSQEAIDNVEFQDQFGGETVILLFTAEDDAIIPDLFSPANLEELARIEDELRGIPEVSAVITPLTSATFSSRIIDEGIGTSGLRHALEDDTDPDSQALRNDDLSTTLFRLGAAGEADLASRSWMEFLLYDNTGFTRDGTEVSGPPAAERTIRLSLRSTFPDQQTAVGGVIIEGNADLDTLSSATEQVLEITRTAEFEGWTVITTGSPVFLKDINDYLQGGMLTLGAAAVALMAVVLMVAFPVRWRLLPLLAVLIAVAWTFSLLGVIGIDLSLVTISGLPILIGLGVDFAIQVHNRVEEEVVLDREDHPMRETLANLGPPLGAATIAAVVAFLVLQVSLVPMIRDFGVMLAIGIVIILVVGIVVPTAILGIREYRARTTSLTEPTRIERAIVRLGGLPQKAVVPVIVFAVGVLVAGILLEDEFEIQSDPVRWVNQDTQTVRDLDTLKEETSFESTLGILIRANHVNAQPVVDTLFGFVSQWDSPEEDRVANSSSMVSTMSKIINFGDEVNPVAPRSEDLEALIDVMPEDIRRALVAEDRTATQVNFRLAPAPLADDAILVDEIKADLEARIAALELPEDSILLIGQEADEPAIRAVPAGLAVVGVGLLENLSANRAVLTYLALVAAGLWLILRHRSLVRALLAMIPVLLAVGMSSVIVAVLGLTLSPLTTVSGPLVIATCTEFSVLILGRYLEERQRGHSPQEATDRASARTGRAFFTSALTTIFGFGVLVFSALPLLSDFGIIVTMNVAVALLSALVVMPPVLVWADTRGWVGTEQSATEQSAHGVVLADRPRPTMAIGAVVLLAVGLVLALGADREEGDAAAAEFAFVPLPTTTTTTTTTTLPDPDDPPEEIDVSQFGTDQPTEFVPSVLWTLLTGAGADPQRAVCTGSILGDRVDLDALVVELNPPEYPDDALVPVIQAAEDCGIERDIIDAAITAARGG